MKRIRMTLGALSFAARSLIVAAAILAGAAAVSTLTAQTQFLSIPTGVATSGQALVATSRGDQVQGTKTLATYTLTSPTISSATITGSTFAGTTAAATTSVTVGSGTAITKIVKGTASITVTGQGIATVACGELTYTVSGLTTADVVTINPPAYSAAKAAPVAARVSGADTLAITFCNPTAAAQSPQDGTYGYVAIRS